MAEGILWRSGTQENPNHSLTEPLKQHPIFKKIIHSALFKDLEEKHPEGSD
jgi:hypothetical protein